MSVHKCANKMSVIFTYEHRHLSVSRGLNSQLQSFNAYSHQVLLLSTLILIINYSTLSDHYLVYVTRKFMGSTKRQRKTISTRKMKNFNNNNFLSDLGQIDRDSIVSSSKDIDEAVNKWSYLLSLVIEKHAPLTELKLSDKYSIWLTKDLKVLARTRDKLKNMAIKNESSIVMASYRHVRNRVNNLNKNLKQEYFFKKIALEKGNLKETWKTLNLLLNKKIKNDQC